MSEEPLSRPRLLVVCGPTGSGKSRLAVELALRIGGEIVGCDALQVYRRLDAATAKPTVRERELVPHHLVDCVDPRCDCTMADWVRAAESVIAAIDARGNVPIVAGGTGLYLRGLLRGVLPAPARDAALRRRLRRILARGGRAKLRGWLARADAASASRIPPGDDQRLVRAVELARSSGGSWSQRLRREGTWAGAIERYPNLKLMIDHVDRSRHREIVERRVDEFYSRGLVDEVQALLGKGVPAEANAFRAIGYREVLDAVRHGSDAESARAEIVTRTWRYVRRQRTWFRSEPGVHRLDAGHDTAVLLGLALDRWGP